MKSMLRAACFLAVAGLMTVASPAAFAGKVVINLGYASAPSSTYGVLAAKFKELAEKYSKGSVEVKVRCCAQLITEDEAFNALQLGTVDMSIITSNNISPHFPLMNVFVLPYIFKNKTQAYNVLEGKVGRDFAKKLYKATGVHLLTYGFVGDRDFYNSRQLITKMADMKGLKIRVPKNRVMIDTYKAFGAAPIPLPWADTPTALQTGTVQGGDNGTSFIKSQKFYEIMPYFSVLECFSYFSPLFASDRVMKKLDATQKAAVLKAAVEAGKYQKKVMSERVAGIRKFLTTKGEGGMKTAKVDKTAFIKAAQGVQDHYAAKEGKDFRALLKAIRNTPS